MSSQNDGIIVILSSPSGAGKTTLVKLLSEKKISIFLFHILRENQEVTRLMEKIIFLLI